MESPSTCSKPLPTPLSQSALFAVTKYCRLRDLNNKHIFLAGLEAGKFNIKLLANSVLGLSSWLADSCLLAVPLQRERERERKRKRKEEKESSDLPSWRFHSGDLI